MGRLAAEGMLEMAGFDAALDWHMKTNHYPPLPSSLIPVAKIVIEKAKQGRWDARVKLPEGVSYQGKRIVPVSACVEAWHLDAFLE